jgi:hypothetical protein
LRPPTRYCEQEKRKGRRTPRDDVDDDEWDREQFHRSMSRALSNRRVGDSYIRGRSKEHQQVKDSRPGWWRNGTPKGRAREVKEAISQQEGSCKIDIQQGQAKRGTSSASKWESRDSVEVSDTFKSKAIEIIPQDNLLPPQEMILPQDPISMMSASDFMVDLISYNSDAIVINP